MPKTSGSNSEFTPRYANYVLFILLCVYAFNFVDRYIFSILIEDIKAELGVSDTVMGFLGGFAFAMVYTTAGIPIARLADRGSRRTIIAIGLTFWSVMTASCGLAQNVVQLAVARIGVGIGEAAGSPPAHSLISDYFPPEKRATALSVYNLGISIGIMIGFIVGGWVSQKYGWRSAFLVVGLPGVGLAILLRLTVREPPRGHSDGEQSDVKHYELADVVRHLLSLRSFSFFALATGMSAFASYGFDIWSAAFVMRIHHMDTGPVGTWLGVMSGLAGAGFVVGGIWADRLGRKDPRWYLWVPALSTLASMPFILLFLLLPAKTPALLAYLPAVFFWNMYLGPVIAISHRLVAVRMRALTSAILFFILNFVGLGAGPLAVGFLSDKLEPAYGDSALRYALLLCILGNLLAATLFIIGAKKLPSDLERAATLQNGSEHESLL